MNLKNEIEGLFRPLFGQKAWAAKVGWGSFVTIEFGPRRLQHHHYHGDWHLWLYMCDWNLNSKTHELANSESKRGLMQAAIDNLNGLELEGLSFDSKKMSTEFIFQSSLLLKCRPYLDAEPREKYWMLFMPDKRVASLAAQGLSYQPSSALTKEEDSEASGLREPIGSRRVISLED